MHFGGSSPNLTKEASGVSVIAKNYSIRVLLFLLCEITYIIFTLFSYLNKVA